MKARTPEKGELVYLNIKNNDRSFWFTPPKQNPLVFNGQDILSILYLNRRTPNVSDCFVILNSGEVGIVVFTNVEIGLYV